MFTVCPEPLCATHTHTHTNLYVPYNNHRGYIVPKTVVLSSQEKCRGEDLSPLRVHMLKAGLLILVPSTAVWSVDY